MSAAPEQESEAAWTGAWASDAQRLFRMLQAAAERAAADPGVSHDDGHVHATAAECKYCPVCQGLAMIRRSGPDVLDRVAEFASGLAATLRAADRDRPPPEDTGDPAARGTADTETMDLRAAETAEPSIPVIPVTTRIDITD